MRLRIAFALPIVMAAGCAAHRQVQYFEAVDPADGSVSYYRLTIEGVAGLGADYQMQAGYFSGAAVDVLRGQPPSLPEVNLPPEQDAVFDRLVAGYYDALLEDPLPSSGGSLETRVLDRARRVWLGQLAPADVASMGMHGSTNPFQFRKLVFWVSAKNVDLRAFASEIDSIMSQAVTLVRDRKQQRLAQQKTQAQRNTALRAFLVKQPGSAPYVDLIDAWLGGAPAKEAKP